VALLKGLSLRGHLLTAQPSLNKILGSNDSRRRVRHRNRPANNQYKNVLAPRVVQQQQRFTQAAAIDAQETPLPPSPGTPSSPIVVQPTTRFPRCASPPLQAAPTAPEHAFLQADRLMRQRVMPWRTVRMEPISDSDSWSDTDAILSCYIFTFLYERYREELSIVIFVALFFVRFFLFPSLFFINPILYNKKISF
jgi:hypothetical protein